MDGCGEVVALDLCLYMEDCDLENDEDHCVEVVHDGHDDHGGLVIHVHDGEDEVVPGDDELENGETCGLCYLWIFLDQCKNEL